MCLDFSPYVFTNYPLNHLLCLALPSPSFPRPTSQPTLIIPQECFGPDELHKVYVELLKRLDDSSDELRVAVTATLKTFFSLLPEDYNRELYKAHLQFLYRGLLIHLDDPNQVM